MLRPNIQLVECVKKNRSGQRSNSSSTCVQIQRCRSVTYHWSSQYWNYRAAPERLMARQLLFSLSGIYGWRSGKSIYNHHSYAEDFSFKQLGQWLRKKPFSNSFLWERRRGSCNHHLFTVTHVQIKTERRKRIWDEFHLAWFFWMRLEEIFIQNQNQKSAVLVPWLGNWWFFWIKFHLRCVFREQKYKPPPATGDGGVTRTGKQLFLAVMWILVK